jgi:hypothetical protein
MVVVVVVVVWQSAGASLQTSIREILNWDAVANIYL